MNKHSTFEESDKYRLGDDCHLEDLRTGDVYHLGEITDIFMEKTSIGRTRKRATLKFENGYELYVGEVAAKSFDSNNENQ